MTQRVRRPIAANSSSVVRQGVVLSCCLCFILCKLLFFALKRQLPGLSLRWTAISDSWLMLKPIFVSAGVTLSGCWVACWVNVTQTTLRLPINLEAAAVDIVSQENKVKIVIVIFISVPLYSLHNLLRKPKERLQKFSDESKPFVTSRHFEWKDSFDQKTKKKEK